MHSVTRTRHTLPIALAMLTFGLAGCSAAPVDPNAAGNGSATTAATPQADAASDTALRDAIQAPQDKARAVEDTLQQAADAQRAAIDAAEADDASS